VGTIERWQETIKRRKNQAILACGFYAEKRGKLEIHNPKILFLTKTATNS
jgi:hypothetical protein